MNMDEMFRQIDEAFEKERMTNGEEEQETEDYNLQGIRL